MLRTSNIFSSMGFTKMKKTLAALAVLGAFAGTAAAADVTLYGDIDTGFAFTHEKVESMWGGARNPDLLSRRDRREALKR